MIRKFVRLIPILFSLSLLPKFIYAQKEPLLLEPGSVWSDLGGKTINAHGGGILYYQGSYYWFGEHRVDKNTKAIPVDGVSCYSSQDLYHWKYNGLALAIPEDTGSIFTMGCIVERPKVIYNRKTKKFVMWFHHELKGQGYKAAMTGVAVSDNITGPYRYIRSLRPDAGYWPLNFTHAQKTDTVTAGSLKAWSPEWRQAVKDGLFLRRDFEGGQMARDMNLFVDDDGKAYHIHASEENQTLHISELSDDYLGFTGRYVRVFPGDANEAPAVFKKNGEYFMFSSGTTGWKPNPGRSAKADKIMGDWISLGNPCQGDQEDVMTTFQSQSTFVLQLHGTENYVFMADRWRPEQLTDSRYIWLPVEWENGLPVIKWHKSWNLDFFNQKGQ